MGVPLILLLFVLKRIYFVIYIYRHLYNGVLIDEVGIRKVIEAARNGPFILLPTHRSYMDFLLTSYVCFYRGSFFFF